MSQNTSSAVMQQRSEPHNSLDDFPTPPWATRALLNHLNQGFDLDKMTCREPAANRGHMVKPLEEYFEAVLCSDIHDYGVGYKVDDYLFGDLPETVDWTITNPPFKLAEQFIERMMLTSKQGCAVIVRSAFLEGVGRYNRLFSLKPPSHVIQFSERVVMHRGKLSEKGSTATAYCWLVWERPVARLRSPFPQHTDLGWMDPCRKRFEKPGDYE